MTGTILLIFRDFDPAPTIAGCVMGFPVRSLIPLALLERDRLENSPGRFSADVFPSVPTEREAGIGSSVATVDPVRRGAVACDGTFPGKKNPFDFVGDGVSCPLETSVDTWPVECTLRINPWIFLEARRLSSPRVAAVVGCSGDDDDGDLRGGVAGVLRMVGGSWKPSLLELMKMSERLSLVGVRGSCVSLAVSSSSSSSTTVWHSKGCSSKDSGPI